MQTDSAATTARPQPRVFIIHAHADADFVHGFLIKQLGLPPDAVMLSSALAPGAIILDELARGAGSELVIVVLSPALASSEHAALAHKLAETGALTAGARDRVVPAIVAEYDRSLIERFREAMDFRDRSPGAWEAQVERLRPRLRDVGVAAPAPLVVDCPYPGMVAFREDDARWFFGRADELHAIVTAVRTEREVYVLGPSGSGKSSLITVGVIPRLCDERRKMPPGVAVAAMRSGSTPAATLAASIARADGEAAAGERPLVVIDQLEEVFRAEASERTAFFDAVLRLREDGRVTLLLALRADHYGALMGSPLWPQLAGRLSQVTVPPLRGAALRAAIEEPARSQQVYFEPALVERLCADAADEPGTLPLLQQTLRELWRRRAHDLIRLEEYEAMGSGGKSGLAATMETVADAAMRALTPAQQAIARRVFVRLIQFGEARADTRRQRTLAELESAADPPGPAGCGARSPGRPPPDHEVGRAGRYAVRRRRARELARRMGGAADVDA